MEGRKAPGGLGLLMRVLHSDLRRKVRKGHSRFERVAPQLGLTGEELRKIYLDVFCTVIDSTDFCRLIREGRLVMQDGQLVEVKRAPAGAGGGRGGE